MSLRWIEVAPEGSERLRLGILHSNGMCGAFYRPLATLLAARGVRSFLYDIPGFAGAPAIEPLGWESLLGATADAIRGHLGPKGVLVGHSLGGLVAVQLAPRIPLGALVLMEPAIFPWRWLASLGGALYLRRVHGANAPAFTNRGPWFWRLHDPQGFPPAIHQMVVDAHAGVNPALVARLHAELPDRYPLPFSQILAPTLVIRGASSGPVMALGQRDLVRRLPNACAAVIPDAGHWLANEQDQRLSDVIGGFAEPLLDR